MRKKSVFITIIAILFAFAAFLGSAASLFAADAQAAPFQTGNDPIAPAGKVWQVTYDTATYKAACENEEYADADFARLMSSAPFAAEDAVQFVYDAANGMPVSPSEYRPIYLKPATYSGKLNIGTMGDALTIVSENAAPVIFSDFTLSYYMESNVYSEGNFRALNAMGDVEIINSVFNAMTSGGNLAPNALSGLHFSSRASISNSTVNYAGALGVTIGQAAQAEFIDCTLITGIRNLGALTVSGGSLTRQEAAFAQESGSAELNGVKVEGAFEIVGGEATFDTCEIKMQAVQSKNSGKTLLRACSVTSDQSLDYVFYNQGELNIENGVGMPAGAGKAYLFNAAKATAVLKETSVFSDQTVVENEGSLTISNSDLSAMGGAGIKNRGEFSLEGGQISAWIAVENEYNFKMAGGSLNGTANALVNSASGNATLRKGELISMEDASNEAAVKNYGVLNINPVNAEDKVIMFAPTCVINEAQFNALGAEMNFSRFGVRNGESGRCNLDDSTLNANGGEGIESVAFENNGNFISQNVMFSAQICLISQKGSVSLKEASLASHITAIDLLGGTFTGDAITITSADAGVNIGVGVEKAVLQNAVITVTGKSGVDCKNAGTRLIGCKISGSTKADAQQAFVAVKAQGDGLSVENCEIEANSASPAVEAVSQAIAFVGGVIKNTGDGLAFSLLSGSARLENALFTAVKGVIEIAGEARFVNASLQSNDLSLYGVTLQSQANATVESGELRGANLFLIESNATLTLLGGNLYANKIAVTNNGSFVAGGGKIEAEQCVLNNASFEMQAGEMRSTSKSVAALELARSSRQTLRGGSITAAGIGVLNRSASTTLLGDIIINADVCLFNLLNISVQGGEYSAADAAFVCGSHSLNEFTGGKITSAAVGVRSEDAAVVRINALEIAAKIGIENDGASSVTLSGGTILASEIGFLNKDAYFEMKGGLIEVSKGGVCVYQTYSARASLFSLEKGILKGEVFFDFDPQNDAGEDFTLQFCGVGLSRSQALKAKVVALEGVEQIDLENLAGAAVAYETESGKGVKRIFADEAEVVYEENSIAFSPELSGKTLTVTVLAYLTVELPSKDFTYCGAPYALEYQSEAHFELFYYRDEELTQTVSPQEVLNAGTYFAVAVYRGETYMDCTSKTAVLKILPATLRVSAEPFTIDEGDNANVRFVYEGFVNGEDENVLGARPKCDTVSEAGKHTATPYGAQAQNYVFEYLPFEYRVNRTSFEQPDQNWGVEGSFDPDTTLSSQQISDEKEIKSQKDNLLLNFEGKKQDVVIGGYYRFSLEGAGENGSQRATICFKIDDDVLGDRLLYSVYLVKKNADGNFERVAFSQEEGQLVYVGEVSGEYMVVALITNLTWLWVSIPFLLIAFVLFILLLLLAAFEVRVLASQRVSVRLIPLPIRRQFGDALKIEEQKEERAFSLEESMHALDRYYQNIVPVAERKKTEKSYRKTTQTQSSGKEKSLKSVDFKKVQKSMAQEEGATKENAAAETRSYPMNQDEIVRFAESLSGVYRVFVKKKGKKVSFKVHGETFLLMLLKGEQMILAGYRPEIMEKWSERGRIMKIGERDWFVFVPDDSFSKDEIQGMIKTLFTAKSEEIDG